MIPPSRNHDRGSIAPRSRFDRTAIVVFFQASPSPSDENPTLQIPVKREKTSLHLSRRMKSRSRSTVLHALRCRPHDGDRTPQEAPRVTKVASDHGRPMMIDASSICHVSTTCRVAFNARGFVHLMQPSLPATQLMHQTRPSVCPIRREKVYLFFHSSTSPRLTVLKTRALNGICLIRRRKTPSFFSLAAASSTGVPRIPRKKDSFVLLGALLIGRRRDCHVS